MQKHGSFLLLFKKFVADLKPDMEYTSYKSIKYYPECSALVEELGYKLVDLKIVPAKTITKISAIVCTKDPNGNMGVNDCAKVHRVLLPKLEELLGTEETSMELTSPGIEHNLKNAAEFALFAGRTVRIWDKTVTDWISGTIVSADDKSVTLKKDDGTEFTQSFENIAKAKFISASNNNNKEEA